MRDEFLWLFPPLYLTLFRLPLSVLLLPPIASSLSATFPFLSPSPLLPYLYRSLERRERYSIRGGQTWERQTWRENSLSALGISI